MINAGRTNGLGTYGTVGLEMVLGLMLPCWVGIKADEHFDTEPYLLLLGFVLGVAHGVRVVSRAIQRANREAEAADQAARKARQQYHDAPR